MDRYVESPPKLTCEDEKALPFTRAVMLFAEVVEVELPLSFEQQENNVRNAIPAVVSILFIRAVLERYLIPPGIFLLALFAATTAQIMLPIQTKIKPKPKVITPMMRARIIMTMPPTTEAYRRPSGPKKSVSRMATVTLLGLLTRTTVCCCVVP